MRTVLTIISLTLALGLAACSKDEGPPPMKSKEIVDRYVDTLVTAQDKAKAVAGDVERRASKMNRSIGHSDAEHTDTP